MFALTLMNSTFVSRFTSGAKNHYSKNHLNPFVFSSLETCMQAFDSIGELRNGKKNDSSSTTNMSENSRSEGSPAMNSTEINENEGPKIHAITQAEVDEQTKSFITPLVKQLGDFTRHVQGMTTAPHPN